MIKNIDLELKSFPIQLSKEYKKSEQYISKTLTPEQRNEWANFGIKIAHQGVRLGRKTYIVDMAEGNRRTDYVAVSNTLIGFILLITGGLSALASLISVEGVIVLLSVLGIIGALKSSTLPDVE